MLFLYRLFSGSFQSERPCRKPYRGQGCHKVAQHKAMAYGNELRELGGQPNVHGWKRRSLMGQLSQLRAATAGVHGVTTHDFGAWPRF